VQVTKNICLKVVPHVLIYKKSAFFQEMAMRRSGARPFFGAMLTKTWVDWRGL